MRLEPRLDCPRGTPIVRGEGVVGTETAVQPFYSFYLFPKNNMLNTHTLRMAFTLLLLASISYLHAQPTPPTPQAPDLTPGELAPLEGQWTGTLTYRDYSTDKQTTIPVRIVANPTSTDKRNWQMQFFYTKEPHANQTEKVRLAKDGTSWDGARVIEKTRTSGGMPESEGKLEFVTEEKGKDNNLPATFRHVWVLKANTLTMEKQVKYDKGGDFFRRNIYQFVRGKE